MDQYIRRYPQLSLPVEAGMHTDPRYTDIVRRGRMPEHPANPFLGSERDEEITVDTPAGSVAVLHLGRREDFVRFVRVMRDRCEPVEIPPSMGALMLMGVTNWNRIRRHQWEWFAQGNRTGWAEEFKRFTADPANYRDVILLVSDGPYSALPADQAGMSAEQWDKTSLTIRTWHELAHFVSRKQWPRNKHPLRDEIVADCIGLTAATGHYDRQLAAALLGVCETGYRPGGRLQNYLPEESPSEEVLSAVRRTIDCLADAAGPAPSPFALLETIETRRLAMEYWQPGPAGIFPDT